MAHLGDIKAVHISTKVIQQENSCFLPLLFLCHFLVLFIYPCTVVIDTSIETCLKHLLFVNIISYLHKKVVDPLISMIVEQCSNVHVLITISSEVNRLDFLKPVMRQNDVQINQCKLKALDAKEARAFMYEKLFHTDITAEQKKR